MAFDDEAFAALMAVFDPAMVVVTTADDTERAGCLVGFHCQASIDPPRYQLRLSKANHTYRVARQASHLAVHLLPEGDLGRKLAEHFGTRSGDDMDKFAGLHLDDDPSGAGLPLLADCPDRFVLERIVLLDDGGDHVAVVGIPVHAQTARSARSARTADAADTTGSAESAEIAALRPQRLSEVDDLTPGHDAEERPTAPTERAPD